MKKILTLILCTAFVLSCLSFAAADEKSVITFWYHDGNPTSNPIFEELIDRFEAAYPQYEVDYVPLPSDSYLQKYNTAIATNSVPDVISFRDTDAASLINQNALLQMDEYFETWDEQGAIEESVIKTVRSTAPDGGIYGLPIYISMDISWANTALMAEKGIEAPKTMSEFLSLCEQYADPEDGSYFYSQRGGTGSMENMLDFILTYAGDSRIFDEEGNCLLNSEGSVAGLEAYASIYWNNWTSKDSVTNGFKEMVAEFGAGTSMYLSHNSSSLPNHKANLGEGNFMNVMAPANDETGIVCTKDLSFFGLAVMKDAQNIEGAVAFVEFMASENAASYLCEHEGRIPINSNVYDDEWYVNDPYIKVYSSIMANPNVQYITHPIWLPTWSEFKTRVQEPGLQAVMLKERTAKDVLDEMAEYLTAAQKEYLASK